MLLHNLLKCDVFLSGLCPSNPISINPNGYKNKSSTLLLRSLQELFVYRYHSFIYLGFAQIFPQTEGCKKKGLFSKHSIVFAFYNLTTAKGLKKKNIVFVTILQSYYVAL